MYQLFNHHYYYLNLSHDFVGTNSYNSSNDKCLLYILLNKNIWKTTEKSITPNKDMILFYNLHTIDLTV